MRGFKVTGNELPVRPWKLSSILLTQVTETTTNYFLPSYEHCVVPPLLVTDLDLDLDGSFLFPIYSVL